MGILLDFESSYVSMRSSCWTGLLLGDFQTIEIFLCLVIGINETVVPVFNSTSPPLALSGVSSGIHKK
jgi:hypothetical protein